jgi:hypothetical protein
MQMHFNSFGDFKVMFVTEDEVYRDFDGVVEHVKQVVAVKENQLRDLLKKGDQESL